MSGIIIILAIVIIFQIIADVVIIYYKWRLKKSLPDIDSISIRFNENGLKIFYDGASKVLAKIENWLNQYFRNTQANFFDSNFIDKVIENTIEEEIERIDRLLPIPLYLGLAGTILGIIWGLGNVESVDNANIVDDIFNNGFLSHVSLAMTASFVGVLSLIILSILWSPLKKRLELNKLALSNTIKVKLNAAGGNNLTAAFYNLQSEIGKFNTDFSATLSSFTTNFSKELERFEQIAELNNRGLEQSQRFISAFIALEPHKIAQAFEKLDKTSEDISQFVQKAAKLSQETNKSVEAISDLYSELANKTNELNEHYKNNIAILTENIEKLNITLNKQFEHIQEALVQSITEQLKGFFAKLEKDYDTISKKQADYIGQVSKYIDTIKSYTENLDRVISETLQNIPDTHSQILDQYNNTLKQMVEKVQKEIDNLREYVPSLEEPIKEVIDSSNQKYLELISASNKQYKQQLQEITDNLKNKIEGIKVQLSSDGELKKLVSIGEEIKTLLGKKKPGGKPKPITKPKKRRFTIFPNLFKNKRK